MKVVLAECAGACYGVQRALRLAYGEAASSRSTQTLGPLIHNPQVVAQLEEQGVSVARDVGDVRADCVVIRSHGVTPEAMRSLQDKGVGIVDATCPHVQRAQEAARTLAASCKTVVIVGEKGHPEVEGLMAYACGASGGVVLAACAQDLPDRLEEPVGVVVQTTQSRAHLDDVLEALRARGIEPVVKDTICSATGMRQQAAAELSRRVDAMVVIGGHNSSNTTRLAEICRENAPIVLHVETAGELRREDLGACDAVGVTAGASTPKEQIDAIVGLLESW